MLQNTGRNCAGQKGEGTNKTQVSQKWTYAGSRHLGNQRGEGDSKTGTKRRTKKKRKHTQKGGGKHRN